VCTDKTGTLTENRMRVRSVFVDDRVQDERALASRNTAAAANLVRAFCVSNDVARDGNALCGDPTEVALAEAAHAAMLDSDAERLAWPRAAEIPFDASAQRMTTVHSQRAAHRPAARAAPRGPPGAPAPIRRACGHGKVRRAVSSHKCITPQRAAHARESVRERARARASHPSSTSLDSDSRLHSEAEAYT
jgi:magnesium-transporting ATPase (P-type)